MKKGIIGVSGEYFVAAELSQLGLVATLTLKNTPRIDILATDLESGSFFNVQVKTMSVGNNTGWRMGSKDEEKSDIKNHYYVFVNLKGRGEIPEYFIIPQNKIADFIKKDHQKFLSRGGKDTTIRVFNPYKKENLEKFENYKNNWDILNK